MGTEVQDLLIRLRSDSSELQRGNAQAEQSFVGLNKAALATGVVLGAAATAFAALISIINEGQGVSELSSAFENLEKKAGGLADRVLPELQAATGGLISNLDLMRASNEALLAGISPEQFQQMAAGVDQLGDAVGVNTKQALDDFTTAMATGVTRGLERTYGLVIDNKKAQEDFAKSIGTTADKLNELGQREAARIAILKAVEEQQKSTGKQTELAGDQLQRIDVAVTNARKAFAGWVNEQAGIVGFFKAIANFAGQAAEGIELTFGNSLKAQLNNVSIELENNQKILDARNHPTAFQSAFGTGVSDKDFNAALDKAVELTVKYNSLEKKLAEVGKQTKRNTADFIDQGKAGEDAAKKVADAAKKAADEAWRSFQQLGKDLPKIFDDIPILGANAGERDRAFEDAADKLKNDLGDAAQYFGDTILDVLNGGDIGDILTSQLKSVASNFAGDLAAQLAVSLGGTVQGMSAGAGFGFLQFQGLKNSLSGKPSSLNSVQGIAERGAAAFATFGASELVNLIGFGGDTPKHQEQEQRKALLDSLFGAGNRSFNGVGGRRTVDSHNFNIDQSNPNNASAVSLTSGIAFAEGGGGKGGSDLNGILANGVAGAKGFNAQLITTEALLKRIGKTAEEEKSSIAEQWKEGTLSVEQFAAGVSSLNLVAQHDLTGPNSVADAIAVVTDNLSDPGTKVEALALAFQEMSQQGITSSTQVHDYLSAHFTPDVVAGFDAIEAAGLNSFDAISNASTDQLVTIATAFKTSFDAAAANFDNLGSSAANSGDAMAEAGDTGNRAFRQAGDGAKYAEGRIRDATKAAREFNAEAATI